MKCVLLFVCFQLNLQGLKNLSLDPSVLNGPVKGIVSYLKSRHKRSVPYYHMKMMIVGAAGRGKTTLLQHLTQCAQSHSRASNVATMGVNVKQWNYQHRRAGGNVLTYHLNCWDFAGQEEFYSTHQCFLSQRSLYVVRSVLPLSVLTNSIHFISKMGTSSLLYVVKISLSACKQ